MGQMGPWTKKSGESLFSWAIYSHGSAIKKKKKKKKTARNSANTNGPTKSQPTMACSKSHKICLCSPRTKISWRSGCFVPAWLASCRKLGKLPIGPQHSRDPCGATVRCCYDTVNFRPNPPKRHPIARPWGRGMGCLWEYNLWCKFCLCHMQNHVMLDHAKTAYHSTTKK